MENALDLTFANVIPTGLVIDVQHHYALSEATVPQMAIARVQINVYANQATLVKIAQLKSNVLHSIIAIITADVQALMSVSVSQATKEIRVKRLLARK